MKTSVEAQEGNKVRLVVEIDEKEFDKAVDSAFRKIAHEVNVPGFRPGKAPRRLLEARIGKDYARQQALQDSLPEYYAQAITAEKVDAIAPPELNITSGAETGAVAFDAVIETRPQIRVPGYDGLQVTIPSPLPSDEEVNGQIDRIRNGFSTLALVERPAVVGDHVKIKVRGVVDGEQVAGLTADDYVYEVGANSVVPELDTQLTGASAGSVLDFTAPVPGDADVTIEFHVEVVEVNEKVLPEVNDEFAAMASEFTTVAELKADVSKQMTMVKRVQSYLALRDETVKALTELVGDEDAPETMINAEVERQMEDLAHRLSHQGATLDQYFAVTGQDRDEFVANLRGQGSQTVKADLALRAVALGEAIEADDADIEAEIVRLAERFKMKPKQVRKNLEGNYQMNALEADVRKSKALKWLMDRVSLVDENGTSINRALLELSAEEEKVARSAIDDAELAGEDDDDDELDQDHPDHDGHDH
jgi:trigger factor